MTVVREAPALHLPDEPLAEKAAWRAAVVDGAWGTADLVPAVAAWLWERWRFLGPAGMDRAGLEAVVAGYRREVWLWVAGERTWGHCCSGLIGRIWRRLPER